MAAVFVVYSEAVAMRLRCPVTEHQQCRRQCCLSIVSRHRAERLPVKGV